MRILTVLTVGATACGIAATAGADGFDFSRQLFGPPSTLSIFIESIDSSTGVVAINGVDSQQPSVPFSWNWGDGIHTEGFFPQQHTYADRDTNYVISVTAHYSGGGTDSTHGVIRFVAPNIAPVDLPPELAASVPPAAVTLGSRMPGYVPPASLTFFADTHFGVVPRATIEYVLSVVAYIQYDLANENVASVGAGFEQVMLRDADLSGGGMYSLWFTDPVAFGAAAEAVSGTISYSSFMHEMGHNFTLNSPAGFYYGGKIDGNANAIFSESMAQIFQHTTAHRIINEAESFGFPPDLAAELEGSAVASMNLVRNSYDQYVQGGSTFESWNNPGTPEDETFDTFMTIAFKFFEHAQSDGIGYRVPLRRMMQLLQTFDQDMEDAYDQHHDTPAAEAFRSTLIVAAMSHGFNSDLRAEFAALNFPIDNVWYEALLGAVPEQQPEACCLPAICRDLTMDDCVLEGGVPAGASSSCATGACPGLATIPATSTWGLVILLVSVLASGTLILRPSRVEPAGDRRDVDHSIPDISGPAK